MSSTKIIKLDHKRAKKFFRKHTSYVNFDLPEYFNFEDLLTLTSAAMMRKELRSVCKNISPRKPDWPKFHEGVNYTILANKDGQFAWRPLQIIHPVLYVDLINTLTTKDNWQTLTKRFEDFSKSIVDCISIPLQSDESTEKDKASQIVEWWEKVEQSSIRKAIQYNFVYTTDITNCYGSIYTHSIEWALDPGGRQAVKARRNSGNGTKTLGLAIDEKLRNMNSGQTNGIPQGSSVMDFIAEIVLGYADLELTRILKDEKILKEDFSILRYRDDYRIFVNDQVLGHKIMKALNNVLADLNFKMNPGKTHESGDVISSSIKPEKLERIYQSPVKQHYQKEALRIYMLSKKHPNSGIVFKELNEFYNEIENKKFLKHTNLDVLIAIFAMIAFYSPKVINWVSAIISKLTKIYQNKKDNIKTVKDVHAKFSTIPNTGLIDVWLQRIIAPLEPSTVFSDTLTELALNKVKLSDVFNSDWLDDSVRKVMDNVEVSDLPSRIINQTITSVIEREEVELFRNTNS